MLRDRLKSASFAIFEMVQKFGFFLMPAHYYVPISRTDHLRATADRWNHPIDVSALPLSLSENLETLKTWIAIYEPEYRGNTVYKNAVATDFGPGYGYVEAQALHGFLRKTAPKRIIEIGSGTSTCCMLAASKINQSEGRDSSSITCIEPFPRARLRTLPVKIVDGKAENVDLSLFDQLQAGDLLFIDSSHAFRPCGDVQRIYLEILPRLKPGVFVHIHDIYIPYAFQRVVTKTYFQWMESALLIAMLNHSTRYRVLLCLSYLHYERPDALKTVFPEYDPQKNNGGLKISNEGNSLSDDSKHFPSSTYLVVR